MNASTLELRAGEERREAVRALLSAPILGSEHPAFPLVRRHEQALVRHFSEFLGYRLELAPGFARLFKRPTAAGLRRTLRIEPGSVSGRARAKDEWPALDRRRAVLLLLTIAALERLRQQTVIGELADRVADAGGRCEPPIPVDFERRSERLAFADALDLLCQWGVLVLTDGSRHSFARAEQGSDEALLTIDRRRLASLQRDPFRLLEARGLDDLLDDRGDYAPTAEGENRRVRHRLARVLVEDPVLYLDRLSGEERAYFQSSRAYLEATVGEWTGLQPERRREGTACVERGRGLTDVAFPAASSAKQAALLLCEPLCRRAGTGVGVIPREELRREARRLVASHGAGWNRSAADPAEVDALLDEALAVLVALDLVEPVDDGVRPLPLAARYREARVSPRAGEH